MKIIETIKNIWKIEDLRTKLGITLLFILIYRFGSFIVLPGIDPSYLASLKQQTSGGLLSLLDMFSGGAFSNALYLCINRGAVARYCRSLLPKDAKRG